MLESNIVSEEVNVNRSRFEMVYVWHARLDHVSDTYLTKLQEKYLLSGLGKIKLDFCEHWVMGKHHRKAFGVGIHSSKEYLEYIHSDMWGPSPIASLSRKWYFVFFIDDYSRFVWVYFLTDKSEVFATFKSWKAQVETQTRRKVRTLHLRVRFFRSDNGGEYTSREF